jgi:hypothetical protein
VHDTGAVRGAAGPPQPRPRGRGASIPRSSGCGGRGRKKAPLQLLLLLLLLLLVRPLLRLVLRAQPSQPSPPLPLAMPLLRSPLVVKFACQAKNIIASSHLGTARSFASQVVIDQSLPASSDSIRKKIKKINIKLK